MLIESADGLIEAIRELELLDEVRLDMLVNDLAARCPEPRDLSRHLIQTGWLTAYQVNQLMRGNGRRLLLGPYSLLERIGSGGMGEVFKARHRRLHRIAAVKVISRQHIANALVLRRFLREAEAAAQLSHPNIVAVHDAGEDGETYYLAMEFIDGIDLAQLLMQSGPLPVPLACDFLRQAALGLEHAHGQGFVHRDIKPQNILAAPRGGMVKGRASFALDRFRLATVKVLDLGLVRSQSEPIEGMELALTQQGVVLGTMDYLAPEQARSSHNVDHRADLYALGCTLYHLLAGQPPFPGGTPVDKILRHEREIPTALLTIRADLPLELVAVIGRLMAKLPEDRPATAAEAALALVPFCSRAPLTVKLARVVVPPPERSFDPLAPTRLLEAQQAAPVESATSEESACEPPPLIRPRQQPAPKPRRWRWVALGALALATVLLLAAGTRRNRGRPEVPDRKPSPAVVDHLADYIPADTAAVIHVRPRELYAAPIFRTPGRPALKPPFAVDRTARAMFGLMNIDIEKDVEQIRFMVSAGRADEVLWLARGRFEPSRFARGEGGFAAVKPGVELYRHEISGKAAFHVAAHGEYLLAGMQRERIESGLGHASKGDSATPTDAELARLLGSVDRKQTLWLAVVPSSLGKAPPLSPDRATQNAFAGLYEQSRAIRGGVRCGDGLEARFVLDCRDERGAITVGRQMDWIRSTAKGTLPFAANAPRGRRLWLLLMSGLEWTRKGEMVEVRSVVRAEQLSEPRTK